MIDFLSMPNTSIFIAGLAVTLLLCLVEGLSLAFAGTSTPSFMDVDSDYGPANGIIAYLNAGQLPLTLFIASAAGVFGLSGLALQQGATTLIGSSLPMLVAVPLACIASIPATHMMSRALGALLPKTETSAISNDDLVGCEGEVMAGIGRRGVPVQVKLRDAHQQAHYVMVEPLRDDEILLQGQNVLITSRVGSLYAAIKSATQILKEI